jgi:hypothetical protein
VWFVQVYARVYFLAVFIVRTSIHEFFVLNLLARGIVGVINADEAVTTPVSSAIVVL